jgi:hypothetical protein
MRQRGRDLLQLRVSAQRAKVRPGVQPDHGRDQARDPGGYRGLAQRRVIRVTRNGAARGHRVAVQAHREGALHVGRRTSGSQGGRGRLGNRQAVLGQCRNHVRDIALRGRKTRNELLRGQKLMVLRIARRVQRSEQRLRGIDVGQSESDGDRDRRRGRKLPECALVDRLRCLRRGIRWCGARRGISHRARKDS